jgi:hypothetical protein
MTTEKLLLADPHSDRISTILHLLWERGCVIFNDVDRYIIIRKLLDYIFNMLPVFIRRWGIQ